MLACAAVAAALVGAFGGTPADAAWTDPSGAPVNDGIAPARNPDLISIGGVPHVAMDEWDGTNREIRVKRMTADGRGWEEIVGGASPINHSPVRDGTDPRLASVDGVPYVVWSEYDGVNTEVRVSRLNAGGTAWVEVGGGANPINHSNEAPAYTPTITVADGVPYVAWVEGLHPQVYVSRLNTAGTGWEKVPGAFVPLSSGSFAFNASITAVGGVPHVAFHQGSGGGELPEVRVIRLKANGTTWEPVVPGPRPIRHSNDAFGGYPSIADVGGVPYVAWTEEPRFGPTQIRVHRLNAAGTAWEEVVGGDSPINHSSMQEGFQPSLTAIDGVPYVAWTETVGGDHAHQQLRVSRLNGAGTAWEEVVGGDSPFGVPLNRWAQHASLTSIGGVPYVAWADSGPGGAVFTDARVSRFEPEFLEQAAIATDREALLLSLVRTDGVPYPIAFEYGPGGFAQRTATARTTADRDEDTTIQRISGLTPDTEFSWRPIGFDGFRATGAGPTETFTTLPAPAPPPVPGPGETPTPAPPASAKLLVAVVDPRLRSFAGRRVVVRYVATSPASVRLEVRRRGRVVAVESGRARAGRNRIVWNGRVAGKRPTPGRYSLILTARSTDGQTARDRATLEISRRAVRSKRR